MKRHAVTALLAACFAITLSCAGEREEGEEREEAAPPGGLTEEQMEKGIGPVTDLDLEDEIDVQLAATGAEIFQVKCSACHQLDQRYVGPPLRDVTTRREPEYVMNMMLNPAEMLEKHPVAKQLLAEYFTPMPSQNLTMDDARALLEYLRQMAQVGQASTEGSGGT